MLVEFDEQFTQAQDFFEIVGWKSRITREFRDLSSVKKARGQEFSPVCRSRSRPNLPSSTVAAGKQILRASLEGLGPWHEEPEGIGQSINRVEREANGERVLNLLARGTGCQYHAHVVRTHRLLARQPAQHSQRCP